MGDVAGLEQAGAFVVPVRYDDDVLDQDPERFASGVPRDLRGALAHHVPTRLTPRGQVPWDVGADDRLHRAVRVPDDTPMIWMTPMWRSTSAWQAACGNAIESLYVVGLADHEYHDAERQAAVPGETIEIPNADLRLEVAGDVLATLDAWRSMADSIV